MKISGYLAVVLLGISVISVHGKNLLPLSEQFIRTINIVEASGRHNNVPLGDNGLTCGPFQMSYRHWYDAIEYDPELAINHKYSDINNYDYAVQIMTAYLNRYAKKYIESNNLDVLARIHNGGPCAMESSRINLTNKYLKKFQKALIP